MAGNKSTRPKDDKPKKRKRDLHDNETKAKRHRPQSQEIKVNGNKEQKSLKSKHEKTDVGAEPSELINFRPQEVVRQSDDGQAGWRISKPMGGRMLDIDPILTEDEQ